MRDPHGTQGVPAVGLRQRGGHVGAQRVPTAGLQRWGTWQPGCPHASHPARPLSPQTRRGSDSEKRSLDSRGEVAGSGRAIPIKQVSGGGGGGGTPRGPRPSPNLSPPHRPFVPPSPSLCPQSFLLKRSGNSLNKEWKKKYVTLSSNGLLFYHPTINVSVPVPCPHGALGGAGTPPVSAPRPSPPQDYIHSTHGKEMDLLRTTVKVPGKRPPRAISACGPSASINGLVKDVAGGTAPEGGGEYRPGDGGGGDDGCPRRTTRRHRSFSNPQPAPPPWG